MRRFFVSVLLVIGFAVFLLWPEERRGHWLDDEVGANEPALPELEVDPAGPRPTVSGHVRQLDGRGVPGVTVRLEHPWVPEVRATTDSEGRFELSPEELRGELGLDAPGWVLLGGERILGEGATQGYLLAVAPPFDQAGRVTRADGTPLAGAEVTARLPVGVMVPLGLAALPLDDSRHADTTDDEGRFHLAGLPAVPGLALDVSAEGHRPGAVVLAPPGTGDAEEPDTAAGPVTIALGSDAD